MPKYRVDYNVVVYYQCVAEIEAESEEDAQKIIEKDYSDYEDESIQDDSEVEVEFVKEIEDIVGE